MSYARALAFAPVMLAATFVTSYAENSSIGAQAEDIGMREYVNNCAVCHGDFGKGDGPLVPWLRQAIPDLTTIQKRSDGVFPFERIYGIVDGREEIGSHGRRDMPVWGKSFSRQMMGTTRKPSRPNNCNLLYGAASLHWLATSTPFRKISSV